MRLGEAALPLVGGVLGDRLGHRGGRRFLVPLVEAHRAHQERQPGQVPRRDRRFAAGQQGLDQAESVHRLVELEREHELDDLLGPRRHVQADGVALAALDLHIPGELPGRP